MVASATVRVMSPEEIAARAGGQTPFLHAPQRASHFAERQMRLLQLAPGHAMGDFLRFMAGVAGAQQRRLLAFGSVPVPDAAALDGAALAGRPPLPATDWLRNPAWLDALRAMLRELQPEAPPGTQAVLTRLLGADDAYLETQADALLGGTQVGLELAGAPLVAAALQVYWTHMVLQVLGQPDAQSAAFGRLEDESLCPCCGSRPTASITRTAGESLGQRYLHCSLCGMQWHMLRIKCAHCLGTRGLAYQALDTLDDGADESSAHNRAVRASVQAETCDECGHYLKIFHTDRDPFVEPVADDLASLTLDLLVSETGKARCGVNLMLFFGDPGPPPDPGAP
jgi:FdhE protein